MKGPCFLVALLMGIALAAPVQPCARDTTAEYGRYEEILDHLPYKNGILLFQADGINGNYYNSQKNIVAKNGATWSPTQGIDDTGAMYFDGNNDYFVVDIDISEAVESEVTLCGWFKPDLVQNNNQEDFGIDKIQLFGHDNAGGDRGIAIGSRGESENSFLTQVEASNLDSQQRYNATTNLDKWIFVCAGYGSSSSVIYTGNPPSNPKSKYTTLTPRESTTAPYTNTFVTFGATSLVTSTPGTITPYIFYKGYIDNVLIVNKLLNEEEMEMYRNIWDDDGDSLNNCVDLCRNLPSTNANADGDGYGDECDNCPRNFTEYVVPDEDIDGVGDLCDNCVIDYNPDQRDSNKDGRGDACEICVDDDSDQVCNPVDNCPDVDNNDQSDVDMDGVGDLCDNCPFKYNPDQKDVDQDQVGDECDTCPTVADFTNTDSDADGVGNVCDNCPYHVNPTQDDTDGDNVGDVCDNCLLVKNSGQKNSDNDSYGDVCDNCPDFTNEDQKDSNGDGKGDACTMCTDPDQDLVCDQEGTGRPGPDNCPNVYNPMQEDRDKDGYGDACDFCPDLKSVANKDYDGDGVGDLCDGCPMHPNADQMDYDKDGIQDACDNCPMIANPLQESTKGKTWGDACPPGAVVVTNICNKVWLVENGKDIEVEYEFDWRGERWQGAREKGKVAPMGHSWIVFDGHSASKQTLYFWENNTVAVASCYHNEMSKQGCFDVIPTCQGKYKVVSKISQPVPLQWETRTYAHFGDGSNAGLSAVRLLGAGETWYIMTTGELRKERLEVWLVQEGSEEKLRKEASVLNRFGVKCPGQITKTGP